MCDVRDIMYKMMELEGGGTSSKNLNETKGVVSNETTLLRRLPLLP